MRIAWSGHRPDVFADAARAHTLVDELARAAPARWGATSFVCGGQRGVDQWAATAGWAIGLSVRLVLPTAVDRFTRDWSADDRAQLTSLLSRVTDVAVVDPDGEHAGLAYDLRNEAIVRAAEQLVVVWTGVRQGGTFHTLCAARTKSVPVEVVDLLGSGTPNVHGRGI